MPRRPRSPPCCTAPAPRSDHTTAHPGCRTSPRCRGSWPTRRAGRCSPRTTRIASCRPPARSRRCSRWPCCPPCPVASGTRSGPRSWRTSGPAAASSGCGKGRRTGSPICGAGCSSTPGTTPCTCWPGSAAAGASRPPGCRPRPERSVPSTPTSARPTATTRPVRSRPRTTSPCSGERGCTTRTSPGTAARSRRGSPVAAAGRTPSRTPTGCSPGPTGWSLTRGWSGSRTATPATRAARSSPPPSGVAADSSSP